MQLVCLSEKSCVALPITAGDTARAFRRRATSATASRQNVLQKLARCTAVRGHCCPLDCNTCIHWALQCYNIWKGDALVQPAPGLGLGPWQHHNLPDSSGHRKRNSGIEWKKCHQEHWQRLSTS